MAVLMAREKIIGWGGSRRFSQCWLSAQMRLELLLCVKARWRRNLSFLSISANLENT